MLYWADKTEELNPEDSLSDNWGTAPKRREEPNLYVFCNRNQVVRTSKDDC